MESTVTPHLRDLIFDALHKSFWKRDHLRDFLIQMKVSPEFLVLMGTTESKRDLLNRLFPQLRKLPNGDEVYLRIARALADQTSFPKLAYWENSEKMIDDAKVAVKALKNYFEEKEREKLIRENVTIRKEEGNKVQQMAQRTQAKLDELKTRLEEMSKRLGTAKAGYDFQPWFYDLMDYFEIVNRRPYMASGRQIDGSVSLDGTTYLVELKFTKDQSDSIDIDSIMAKVSSKADNTMGLMVSISGYSYVAIEQASLAKSPLLLIDASHVYMILMGNLPAQDVLLRVRRHSAQTGRAYLPVGDF